MDGNEKRYSDARDTGRQGTNKFHLLLADFRYCQNRKLKEITWRDQGLAFIISGFPLLLGPLLRDLTVEEDGLIINKMESGASMKIESIVDQ